jgi:alkyl hydroperoxide reductase subunit AhpF
MVSLISAPDQQRLRDAFAEMTQSVRLFFFTQALGCDTCAETRRILDELPPLSDKITIEEVNFVLDADKVKEYGIDRVPSIAVVGRDEAGVDRDSRIRFAGAPSGYEFSSLIHAVLLVGGRPSGLSDAQRQRLASVDRPIVMQVFTTPT